MSTFPTADELEREPKIGESGAGDLRREEEFGPTFSTVRLWCERGDTADGLPYDRTVTVEVREYIPGRPSHYDLGQYDGDDPPEEVGGYTMRDLFRD